MQRGSRFGFFVPAGLTAAVFAAIVGCNAAPYYERVSVEGGAPSTGGAGHSGMGGVAAVGGRGGRGGRGDEGGRAATGGALASGDGGAPAKGGSPGAGGVAAGGAIATGGVGGVGGTGSVAPGGSSGAAGGGEMGGNTAVGGGLASGGLANGGTPGIGGSAGTAGAGGTSGAGGGGGGPIPGVVLHYAFDEASGTVARDDAGSAENGILVGASFVAGLYGNCASFHGTNEHVVVPSMSAALGDTTIAFWVNLSAHNNWQRVFDFGNGPTTGYWTVAADAVRTQGNGLRFSITKTDGTSSQVLDGPSLPLNQWKHVAIVLGSSGGSLYIDGAVVASATGLNLRPKDLGATPNNWIGRSQFSNDPYLNGHIDDFYLFNRALTPAEVTQVMAGP